MRLVYACALDQLRPIASLVCEPALTERVFCSSRCDSPKLTKAEHRLNFLFNFFRFCSGEAGLPVRGGCIAICHPYTCNVASWQLREKGDCVCATTQLFGAWLSGLPVGTRCENCGIVSFLQACPCKASTHEAVRYLYMLHRTFVACKGTCIYRLAVHCASQFACSAQTLSQWPCLCICEIKERHGWASHMMCFLNQSSMRTCLLSVLFTFWPKYRYNQIYFLTNHFIIHHVLRDCQRCECPGEGETVAVLSRKGADPIVKVLGTSQ